MIAKFDSRRTYFDGVGTKIGGTKKTSEAIKISGLDYNVIKKELYLDNGIIVPDKFATVREDTGDILGIVGKNYNIVQNIDGFSFIDEIIGNGGADFECAGPVGNGRMSFMTAKTDPIRILDDNFDPYILFINSHDGSTPVKCMFTPIRTICSNCFAVASNKASFKISIRHSSDVMEKLYIANAVMKSHTAYIDDVKSDAEALSTTVFTKEQFEDALYRLIEIKPDSTKTIVDRAEEARVALMRAYEQPDLDNYSNSAWRAVQAVSDYVSHYTPKRDTKNEFIYMQRVQNGEMAKMLGLMIAIIIAKNPALNLKIKY